MLSIDNFGSEDIFVGGCCSVIGKGFSTSFWHVKWISNKTLKEVSPSLFAIFVLQNMVMATLGGWRSDGTWEWSDFGILVSGFCIVLVYRDNSWINLFGCWTKTSTFWSAPHITGTL